MGRNTPFAAAIAMFSAIAAAQSLPAGHQRQSAMNDIGPYESRGKGGKRPHRSTGTKAFQRMAAKRRNKKGVH